MSDVITQTVHNNGKNIVVKSKVIRKIKCWSAKLQNDLTEILTEADCQYCQTELGYNPSGYSFFDFRISTDRQLAKWSCNLSAD